MLVNNKLRYKINIYVENESPTSQSDLLATIGTGARFDAVKGGIDVKRILPGRSVTLDKVYRNPFTLHEKYHKQPWHHGGKQAARAIGHSLRVFFVL